RAPERGRRAPESRENAPSRPATIARAHPALMRNWSHAKPYISIRSSRGRRDGDGARGGGPRRRPERVPRRTDRTGRPRLGRLPRDGDDARCGVHHGDRPGGLREPCRGDDRRDSLQAPGARPRRPARGAVRQLRRAGWGLTDVFRRQRAVHLARGDAGRVGSHRGAAAGARARRTATVCAAGPYGCSDAGDECRHLTTENTARDWERVRQALGVEQISIHGLSYGTLLGSTYATLFPEHTDKMVLDSGVHPDWMWNQVLLEQNEPYKQRVHA